MDYLYAIISCLTSCCRLYHCPKEEIKMGITFFTIQQDLKGNRALMRLEDTRGIQTRITLHAIVDYIQIQKFIRPETSTSQ
jgi:hypothetical protein